MKVELYDIIPELQPYVKAISSIENPSGSNPSVFRVLPDTCVEIFFGYTTSPIAKIDGKDQFESSRSFVASRMSRYMDAELPPNSGSIAVCFKTGAAFHFFKHPMKELTNYNILLADLWGKKIDVLEESLSVCKNNKERVHVIQSFLCQLLKRGPANKNEYEYCLWQIKLYKGQMPLKTLSKKTNISQRHLSRLFNSFLGLPPKEFSRITRFLSSLDNIKKYPSYSLTQIAYESGYFDQAHFIHDCKTFSGLTPKELVSSKIAVY